VVEVAVPEANPPQAATERVLRLDRYSGASGWTQGTGLRLASSASPRQCGNLTSGSADSSPWHRDRCAGSRPAVLGLLRYRPDRAASRAGAGDVSRRQQTTDPTRSVWGARMPSKGLGCLGKSGNCKRPERERSNAGGGADDRAGSHPGEPRPHELLSGAGPPEKIGVRSFFACVCRAASLAWRHGTTAAPGGRRS
jgi:hypothetical protein